MQSSVTGFATIVTKENIPGDFHIQLRYRPLNPGTYRSVGFSFDFLDKGNSQDVYTSTGDARQSVQAFHRLEGKQVYPKAGIVSTSLNVEQETSLDVTVIGSGLTIDLNGVRKLDYTMPVKRRDGKFALWVHQGAAEFLELNITELAQSRETLQRRLHDAQRAVEVCQAELRLSQGESDSLQKRLAADTEKYINQNGDAESSTAREARKAELTVDVLKAELAVAKARTTPDKLAEAKTELAAARLAANDPRGDYRPVGKQYPKTSTGRRSALARWITGTKNPRTARIAANHIWARHFGKPLVATPNNFGTNGSRPTHPQLLDWLAWDLMANNWQMKKLHRKLVLSATYRMSSAPELTGEQSDAHGLARQRESRQPDVLAGGFPPNGSGGRARFHASPFDAARSRHAWPRNPRNGWSESPSPKPVFSQYTQRKDEHAGSVRYGRSKRLLPAEAEHHSASVTSNDEQRADTRCRSDHRAATLSRT